MGCTPSKQSVCRNCKAQCSPVRRSYSSHPRRSPPRQDDNHHVVALTPTTLGYLLLQHSTKHDHGCKDPAVARIHPRPVRRNVPEKVITKNAPKTPIRTPPGEPETINAWELMEGLDDDASPLHLPSSTRDPTRCLSFNDSIPLDQSTLPSQQKDPDADVSSKPLIDEKSCDDAKKPLQNSKKETGEKVKLKLILYFTTLRGVRKTYEDCCYVRVILKNSGVRVDERDVSMHSGFKDELKELLGDRYGGGGLPKVFVGRKYIGGVDEIRRFHDEFQLDKVLEGCEMEVDCGGGGCEACGDVRFLPCKTCSGSCKIYHEVNSDEGEKEEVEDESDNYGFQRCPDCNENGLMRCPICCN